LPVKLKAVKDRTAILIAGSTVAAPVKHTSRKAAGKGAASVKSTARKVTATKSSRCARHGSAGKETAQVTD
jgi:hypothetical protein